MELEVYPALAQLTTPTRVTAERKQSGNLLIISVSTESGLLGNRVTTYDLLNNAYDLLIY